MTLKLLICTLKFNSYHPPPPLKVYFSLDKGVFKLFSFILQKPAYCHLAYTE